MRKSKKTQFHFMSAGYWIRMTKKTMGAVKSSSSLQNRRPFTSGSRGNKWCWVAPRKILGGRQRERETKTDNARERRGSSNRERLQTVLLIYSPYSLPRSTQAQFGQDRLYMNRVGQCFKSAGSQLFASLQSQMSGQSSWLQRFLSVLLVQPIFHTVFSRFNVLKS